MTDEPAMTARRDVRGGGYRGGGCRLIPALSTCDAVQPRQLNLGFFRTKMNLLKFEACDA